MNNRSFLWLVFSVLVLSGCRDTSEADPKGNLPVAAPASERRKVELCPESSPEQSRSTFFNERDELVRAEIEYRDKSVGCEIFDSNGKVKERWRTYPAKKQVKLRETYDGKGEVVTHLEYHSNGKVYQDLRRQKNGDYRLSQYWDTGLLSTELLVRTDGTAERLSYSDDGKRIDGRTVVLANGEIDSW